MSRTYWGCLQGRRTLLVLVTVTECHPIGGNAYIKRHVTINMFVSARIKWASFPALLRRGCFWVDSVREPTANVLNISLVRA